MANLSQSYFQKGGREEGSLHFYKPQQTRALESNPPPTTGPKLHSSQIKQRAALWARMNTSTSSPERTRSAEKFSNSHSPTRNCPTPRLSSMKSQISSNHSRPQPQDSTLWKVDGGPSLKGACDSEGKTTSSSEPSTGTTTASRDMKQRRPEQTCGAGKTRPGNSARATFLSKHSF